ncbi:transposase family protein [Actinocorallia populi]|uniref:transposase family protein n=1 Tax=Actinocorallia populi TaxID=2079200 RepID=UPI000D0923CE
MPPSEAEKGPARTDRLRADRCRFSGKHRAHGMNVQVIAGADGSIVWTSGAMPGSVHALTTTRIWGIPRTLVQGSLLVLADKGRLGAAELLETKASRPHRSRRTAPTPSSEPPVNVPWPG